MTDDTPSADAWYSLCWMGNIPDTRFYKINQRSVTHAKYHCFEYNNTDKKNQSKFNIFDAFHGVLSFWVGFNPYSLAGTLFLFHTRPNRPLNKAVATADEKNNQPNG